jgi:tRNA pseudouridine55 synthase
MLRTLDGALLLDKPAGISSNAALQEAKRLYRARKAGHAGTLDPLASGLLPVLFGEATKFAGPLLDAPKHYVARVKLGETTATGDAEGAVLERRSVDIADSEIDAVLARFRGAIRQVPPMYSALKHQGRPLYELAREGKSVERRPREVEIHELQLLCRAPNELELRVRCSKGTYVRTLAEDIGAALGVGAHLAALRRTATGTLRVEDATTLDGLERMEEAERDARLLDLPGLLQNLPRAQLEPGREARFRNGQAVADAATREGLHAVFAIDGRLIGLGQGLQDGVLRPLRLMAAPPSGAQPAE